LHFYQANTTAPQNVYKDLALTLVHPNPITLDGAGRIPEFYLADGTVHICLTSSTGVVQLDAANTLVVGPSGRIGGDGGSVDPASIFQTGDELFIKISGPRSGWARQNGNTIGNATSGATERANADTQALFVYLWRNFSDGKCPVVGGRGASAVADYIASKRIALPDMRGRGAIGVDDMGAPAAGRIANSNVTSPGDTATTCAATGGEANHVLSVNEMPPHTHTATVTDPGHVHTTTISGINLSAAGGNAFNGGGNAVQSGTNSAVTGVSVNVAASGGGDAHNNMPPFALGTWYIKF